MTDEEIKALFEKNTAFDDHDAFRARVSQRLSLKSRLRQGLIAIAGFVGGVYALSQVINLPQMAPQTQRPSAVHEVTLGSEVKLGTDETLRAGVQWFDDMARRLADMFALTSHYADVLHTPVFFWLSFSLCVGLIGLYYAYSQEEVF